MSDVRRQDELKRLVPPFQHKIFALAFYLVGGDGNAAYEIASSAFAEAIQDAGPPDVFLPAAAAKVIAKSRTAKTMPSFDPSCLTGIDEREKGVLGIVGRALQALPFDEKALILLRDQMHLPYADVAIILGGNERDVRAQTEEARARLRDNIEGWAKHKDAPPDGM